MGSVKLMLCSMVVLLAIVSLPASAAEITGVTIEDVSSELAVFNRYAYKCIDGSGLVGGLHDSNADNMWLNHGTYRTPHDPLPAEIIFDLGDNYSLNGMHIWNYNEANVANRGCKDVEIWVSSGIFPIKLDNAGGDFVFLQATGSNGDPGFYLDLSGVTNADALQNVRYIRFNILTNFPGGSHSFVGLSEVKFDGKAAVVATSPDPADGETDVEVDLSARTVPGALSWVAPVDPNIVAILGYNVYVDPNASKVFSATPASTDLAYMSLQSEGQTGTSLSLGTDLNMDKTYYWRVDPVVELDTGTEPNAVLGSIWSFDTELSVPVITADPSDAAIFLAETASFSVSLTSFYAPTVAWYQQGTPDVMLVQGGVGSTTVGDYTLTVTDLGAGAYSAILDIANLEAADQGYYYCSVTNVVGSDVSASAALTVKRLLAHYPFENNANDIAGSEDGTPVNVSDPGILPTYAAGIIGTGAVELNGSQYIELSTNAYPKPGLGNGLDAGSFSCWVRVNSLAEGQNAMLLATSNDLPDRSTIKAYVTAGSPKDTVKFWIRSGNNTIVTYRPDLTGNAVICDGQWHFVAATYNGSTGLLYVDGNLIAEHNNYSTNPDLNSWAYPVGIGADTGRGGVNEMLNGALDDVRLYNYALEKLDVADLYLQGRPGSSLCILGYASEFDIAGPDGDGPDCVVNLYDFAKMVTAWLSCGLYPDCQ